MKFRLNVILTVSMGIVGACADGDMELDERTVTAIGQTGGTAQSAAGQMSLQFEAGTLSGTQEIVIDTLRNVDVPQAVSPVYALGPDGITFGSSVRMNVQLERSALASDVQVAIARVDGVNIEVLANSEWDSEEGRVSADLSQFANYAAVIIQDSCLVQSDLVVQTVSEYNPSVPMTNVRVQVNEFAWVPVNAAGRACFPAVSGPYTVRVYQTFTGGLTGTRFDDVWVLLEQSANPLVLPVDDNIPGRDVEISGQFTGLSGQGQVRLQPSLGFIGESTIGANNNFDLRYNWKGPTPNSSTLYALESDSLELPTQYFSYGSTEVTVDAPLSTDPGAPGTLSGVSISMSPVNTLSASGEVNVPPIFVGADQSVGLSVDVGDTILSVGNEQNADWSSPFEYAMPEIPGGQARLYFYVSTSFERVTGNLSRNGPLAGRSIEFDLPANGLTVDLPEPATLVQPLPDATVPANAEFRWDLAPTAGNHFLSAKCVGTDANGEFRINYRRIQGETQASLPSIPRLELPSGTFCEWSVNVFGSGFDSNSGSRGITIQ